MPASAYGTITIDAMVPQRVRKVAGGAFRGGFWISRNFWIFGGYSRHEFFVVHDAVSGRLRITHCPWRGTKLPAEHPPY